MDESRIFWKGPDSGSEPHDEKTVIIEPGATPPAPPSPRQLFLRHYNPVREWLKAPHPPGLALVALDVDALRGAAYLAAKPGLPTTAIVGRHSRADLRLADPSLSLRHLVVLLYPRPQENREVRFRLLDLRTASGFIDERGKRLRAIEAGGPAFVRCGRYWLLFFPVGDTSTPWPEQPESAWQSIPDRLYLDEVETEEKPRGWEVESDRAWEVDKLPKLTEPPTLVHRVAGPQMAVHELTDEGNSILGEIHLASNRGAASVVIGESAARAGVLLGRSRRCDAGRVLSDRSISRVHLLIIEIAGRMYAVDTASYNGTWADEGQERVTPLEPERALSLGEVASLVWREREQSISSGTSP